MVISWNLIFTWAVKKTACFLHQFFFFFPSSVCVVSMCVHRSIWAGPTFRLMACVTCFSFNTEQNPMISNIIKNWPSFFSWVTETQWRRAVQCSPVKMLLGFVVKKHRRLVTALFPPHVACVEPRQGFSWHHLMPQRHEPGSAPRGTRGPSVSSVALGGLTHWPQLGAHPDPLNLKAGPDRWWPCTRALVLGACPAAFPLRPCGFSRGILRQAGGSNGHFGFFGFVFR